MSVFNKATVLINLCTSHFSSIHSLKPLPLCSLNHTQQHNMHHGEVTIVYRTGQGFQDLPLQEAGLPGPQSDVPVDALKHISSQ